MFHDAWGRTEGGRGPSRAPGRSIDAVGRTAFVTCQWRADETQQTTPLFDDAFAKIFLDAETKLLADRLADVLPEAKEMIRYRTRRIDDHVREVADEGRQVVILGAGFDTRAIRMARPGTRYFEVDRGPILEFKSERLRSNRVQAAATFVTCDYVTDDLLARLVAHDFDPTSPTTVIWEGNTFFLQRSMIRSVLERIRAGLRRFSVAFDYMSDRVISRSSGHPEITRFADAYESLGAAFMAGLTGASELGDELELEVSSDQTAAELHRSYFPGSGGALPLFDFYAVAILTSERQSG
jgi:methyltransferase (TIGR00027 family)